VGELSALAGSEQYEACDDDERSNHMNKKAYSSYDFDRLDAAEKLKIERSVYFEPSEATIPDLRELTALPLAELERQREESAAAEQTVFEALQVQAAAWEEQAGNTRFLDKAIVDLSHRP